MSCKRDAHQCQRVPVTSFRTGINDGKSGLHHDYEVWLEKLAPHAPIDQYWHNRTGEACPEGIEGTPVLNEVTGTPTPT